MTMMRVMRMEILILLKILRMTTKMVKASLLVFICLTNKCYASSRKALFNIKNKLVCCFVSVPKL